MRISLIAALGPNWVMGNKGKLPWHLPADLKRFRDLTKGHTILMGRKTAESLEWKPLKDRVNLVLTNSINHLEIAKGFLPIKKLKDAIALAEIMGETELFIIGGAQVFEVAEPYLDRMYLTIISADFEGDIAFDIDFDNEDIWDLTDCEKRLPDKKNPYEMRFTIWDSKKIKNYPDD